MWVRVLFTSPCSWAFCGFRSTTTASSWRGPGRVGDHGAGQPPSTSSSGGFRRARRRRSSWRRPRAGHGRGHLRRRRPRRGRHARSGRSSSRRCSSPRSHLRRRGWPASPTWRSGSPSTLGWLAVSPWSPRSRCRRTGCSSPCSCTSPRSCWWLCSAGGSPSRYRQYGAALRRQGRHRGAAPAHAGHQRAAARDEESSRVFLRHQEVTGLIPEALAQIARATGVRNGFALILNHNTGDSGARARRRSSPRMRSAATRPSIVDLARRRGRALRSGHRPAGRPPAQGDGEAGVPRVPRGATGGEARTARRGLPAPPRQRGVLEAAVPTLRALTGQVALVVRNIQYNEELARKNEELTHLDQLKSDLMAMSHECARRSRPSSATATCSSAA